MHEGDITRLSKSHRYQVPHLETTVKVVKSTEQSLRMELPFLHETGRFAAVFTTAHYFPYLWSDETSLYYYKNSF